MKSRSVIAVFIVILIAGLFAVRFFQLRVAETSQLASRPVDSAAVVERSVPAPPSESPIEKARWGTTSVEVARAPAISNAGEKAPSSGSITETNSAWATPTNIPLPRFVGGHRANVPPGGALVTGGWPQPNGNRLLMFASPVPLADGETIEVRSRFVSLPPSRLIGGGWEKFMTDDAVATAGGVFSASEYRETMKAIEGFKDIDVLSSPSLTLRYGPAATIQIMAERIAVKDGKPVLIQDGLEQGIIARKVEGSSDVDLAVSSAQYDSGTNAPPPAP